MSTLKLRPIDAGFDARKTGQKIIVPDDATVAEILDKDEKPHLLQGDAVFIRRSLPNYGYEVAESPFKKFNISRTGLPPMKFTGRKIAFASTKTVRGEGQNRWTEVAIYRTKGGKWIGYIGSITCWQGEFDHYKATSCDSPQSLIDWLRDDYNGTLGRASQEACEEAAKADAEFAAAFVEEVE